MRGTANRLRTAARDVRVTRTMARGPRLTVRGGAAQRFALGVMGRLRRSPRLFAPAETCLRHTVPQSWIRPLYQQNRIELAPRLTLTVRPERQVRSLERQIQSRLLWRPGVDRSPSSPLERIVCLVSTCLERQRGLSSPERPSVDAATAMQNIVTQVGADPMARPFDVVPNHRQLLAIEMVVHRPQSAVPRPSDTPSVSASEWPQAREHRPAPSPDPAPPALDGGSLRRLTDSVVEALERRTIAAYERAARRSV